MRRDFSFSFQKPKELLEIEDIFKRICLAGSEDDITEQEREKVRSYTLKNVTYTAEKKRKGSLRDRAEIHLTEI